MKQESLAGVRVPTLRGNFKPLVTFGEKKIKEEAATINYAVKVHAAFIDLADLSSRTLGGL